MKRLETIRFTRVTESKLPFVSRIELIGYKLSMIFRSCIRRHCASL